jgi:DNA modification methylase
VALVCPWSSAVVRPKGCQIREDGGLNRPAPRQSTRCAVRVDSSELARNTHPCVKPVALMRYLCRLITPPRGTVLDPFMGSASTGVAAVAEGLTFLGIEAQPPYFDLAQARMRQAIRESRMSSVRAA